MSKTTPTFLGVVKSPNTLTIVHCALENFIQAIWETLNQMQNCKHNLDIIFKNWSEVILTRFK